MKLDFCRGTLMTTFEAKLDVNSDESAITQIFRSACDHIGVCFDTLPDQALECSEILVAEDIGNQALDMLEETMGAVNAGMLWCMCGPKISHSLPYKTVAVSDMFCKAS